MNDEHIFKKYWDGETSDSCIITAREEYAVESRLLYFLKKNCIRFQVLVNKCWEVERNKYLFLFLKFVNICVHEARSVMLD